jgi:hypothetical protein
MTNNITNPHYNSLWSQFGAALEMLEESIQTCPRGVWEEKGVFSFQTYHALFFLDYYLSTDPVGFTQPPNFSYSECLTMRLMW